MGFLRSHVEYDAGSVPVQSSFDPEPFNAGLRKAPIQKLFTAIKLNAISFTLVLVCIRIEPSAIRSFLDFAEINKSDVVPI